MPVAQYKTINGYVPMKSALHMPAGYVHYKPPSSRELDTRVEYEIDDEVC